jgi:hypothetical protein
MRAGERCGCDSRLSELRNQVRNHPPTADHLLKASLARRVQIYGLGNLTTGQRNDKSKWLGTTATLLYVLGIFPYRMSQIYLRDPEKVPKHEYAGF